MTTLTPLLTTCRRCTAEVLEVRWDYELDLIIGRPFLDPVALNSQQVIACVITGIHLWQIHRTTLGGVVTSHRSPLWPKQPIDGDTAPVHKCGRYWDGPPLNLAPTRPPTYTECPF